MSAASNAIETAPVTQDTHGGDARRAVAWGLVGVVAFSFSLPATRLAVEDLDPTFVGLGRALVAAVLAAVLLAVRTYRARGRPTA
jgi:drug/metabolite transporter (DMT)-like permease